MLKVLHVVETLVSGIHTFLEALTNHQCNSFEVYIAHGVRPFTHKNFKDCFDSRVQWIEVHNFQRAVGIKDIKAFFELKRIVREVRPDIIHLHSSKAGVLGRWVFDGNRHKIFYTPNGFSFLMRNNPAWKRSLYWLIEYSSAKTKALTIACGKGEYEEALKLSSRCTYVNNGVNIHELHPFLTKDFPQNTPPLVCTSGRISSQKNPRLFNAIALLLPHIRFIWIGDGGMRSLLTARNIEITGWLPRKEALKVLAKAHSFLLLSLWEGLPLSLLEAMFLKKLCLVSDVPGNRDLIDNGRNGFICHTPEEYAQHIHQMLLNECDDMTLAEQAHQDIVAFYNTDSMASAYKKIYDEYKTC
jgi:glycosyltransferase involved in cell wall biosynthesis